MDLLQAVSVDLHVIKGIDGMSQQQFPAGGRHSQIILCFKYDRFDAYLLDLLQAVSVDLHVIKGIDGMSQQQFPAGGFHDGFNGGRFPGGKAMGRTARTERLAVHVRAMRKMPGHRFFKPGFLGGIEHLVGGMVDHPVHLANFKIAFLLDGPAFAFFSLNSNFLKLWQVLTSSRAPAF